MKQSPLAAQYRRLAKYSSQLEIANRGRESVAYHFKGRNAGFRFALVSNMHEVRKRREELQARAHRYWIKTDFVNYGYFEGFAAALSEVIALHVLSLQQAAHPGPR